MSSNSSTGDEDCLFRKVLLMSLTVSTGPFAANQLVDSAASIMSPLVSLFMVPEKTDVAAADIAASASEVSTEVSDVAEISTDVNDITIVSDTATDATHSKEVSTSQAHQHAEDTWSFLRGLRNLIGADVLSMMSIPISFMEPSTMLQRLAEAMEYKHLLDRAARTIDPVERLAWICAFCTSAYGAVERIYKPFNPILGETYQFYSGDNFRLFAEQVSHHPPIACIHAETDEWEYDLTSAPQTKFLGSYLNVCPFSHTRIRFKGTGELFVIKPPNLAVYGVLIQRMWIDAYGDLTITNITTGEVCSLNFKACGWFGAGRYELAGSVYDHQQIPRVSLQGHWNDHLRCSPGICSGDEDPNAVVTELWKCNAKPKSDPYGYTTFARDVLTLWDANAHGPLLRSDSRLRPDAAALRLGDSSMAQSEKLEVEQRQRQGQARNTREWAPRWFQLVTDAVCFKDEHTIKECPVYNFLGRWPDSPKLSDEQTCAFDGSESPKRCKEFFSTDAIHR